MRKVVAGAKDEEKELRHFIHCSLLALVLFFVLSTLCLSYKPNYEKTTAVEKGSDEGDWSTLERRKKFFGSKLELERKQKEKSLNTPSSEFTEVLCCRVKKGGCHVISIPDIKYIRLYYIIQLVSGHR